MGEGKKVRGVPELDKILKLIYKEAYRCYNIFYGRQGTLSVEDLVSEGIVCYYRAAKKYDPDKASFNTFLVRVIRCRYHNVLYKEQRYHAFDDSVYLTQLHAHAPTISITHAQELPVLEPLSKEALQLLELAINPTTELERFLQATNWNKLPCAIGRFLGWGYYDVSLLIQELHEKMITTTGGRSYTY